MSIWSEGLWDTSDVEAESRQSRLITARMATAGVWPFLTSATDREDFANRLELARHRFTAAAEGDEDLAMRVEAAYVQDFEALLKDRHEAAIQAEAGMSAQHYNWIADSLHSYQQANGGDLADHFANQISHTNPLFDSGRFTSAVNTRTGLPRNINTPSMTRQHFQTLADAIKAAPDEHRSKLANHFADRLGQTNGGFKRDRFLKAAGASLQATADKAPYYIESKGDKWVVVNKSGEVKGTHGSKAEAREQQKAMYANIPDASEKAEKAHGDPKPKVKESNRQQKAAAITVTADDDGLQDALAPIEMRASVSNSCDSCHGPIYRGERYVYEPMSNTRKCGGCAPRDEAMRRVSTLACFNCKTAVAHEDTFCGTCGFLREASITSCPECGRRTSDLDSHFDNFHPDSEGIPYEPRDWVSGGSPGKYNHWGDFDEEGNARGTGTGRGRGRNPGNRASPRAGVPEGQVRRDVYAAKNAGGAPEEVETPGSQRREARHNSFEDEYDAGLPCKHANCTATFYSESARTLHLADEHGQPARPARGVARVARAITRRSKEEKNLKKACPVCGKEIPASEMAAHMKKEHPHQAVKPDDEERGEEAEAKERETKERKEKHKPSERRREGAKTAANPFSTSTADNPFVPSGGTEAPTVPPETVPSTMSASPGSTGVDTAAMSPMQDLNQPSNMNPRAAHKIAVIAADLQHLNPGIDPDQAMRLAQATLQRYPALAVEARGGADYIEGERTTTCPQCGKDAFAPASSHCHFCGYVAAA